MKNAWKWILGILLSLLVICLAVVPLFFRVGYRYMPMMRGGFRGDFHVPGAFGFMGGLMALRMVLLPLLVVALLVLIGFWIGSARRNSVQSPPTAQPLPQASPPVATTSISEEKHCTHCGNTLQPEWAHCPSCGTKVE